MRSYRFFQASVFLLLTCIAVMPISAQADQGSRPAIYQAIVNDSVAKEEALIKEKYPNAIRTSSGLMYIILKEGNGATPNSGALVEAHYTGMLLDGTKFDSSVDRGKPLLFLVGRGEVIKGWDEAFLSMKKGEKRILIIPPGLAYGDKGMGTIPPNETLIFEVELMYFLQ
ncbi:MAG: FKBP-type peptidyl-prolyl cis-trans isomerase [Deltaproteobacteria bacterium]|nr:FKBP-type peptidyl-prolyl cis-trans isomerase [Deltaproteobacteria bacterium]